MPVGNAIDYAKFYSRSHDTVICVYDEVGNVIVTHDFALTLLMVKVSVRTPDILPPSMRLVDEKLRQSFMFRAIAQLDYEFALAALLKSGTQVSRGSNADPA
jgi:hypothetical protein